MTVARATKSDNPSKSCLFFGAISTHVHFLPFDKSSLDTTFEIYLHSQGSFCGHVGPNQFYQNWSSLFHLMDRFACWTSPGDVHGLLGNAALEHVDMLVDKGSSVYNTMNTMSEIGNALLSAVDLLLQSFMKLDDRGGFFKQADMEQASGSEERWRRTESTTFLGCRTRFVSCCRTSARRTANTCKKSVERASRPHLFVV